jgi:hypothetical protein
MTTPTKKLKVLVACEYSGTVRDSFLTLGHDALSCDLLPTDTPGPHYQGDIRDLLNDSWDLVVAFPPCTYLCSSGMHWTTRGKRDPQLTEDALSFVKLLLDAPIPHIALENPVGVISSRLRKPDCIVQPWQFGHPETKATCLWLKNLPVLQPTNVVEGREQRIWKLPPGPDRWKIRSQTFPGIAKAMAEQWSNFILNESIL